MRIASILLLSAAACRPSVDDSAVDTRDTDVDTDTPWPVCLAGSAPRLAWADGADLYVADADGARLVATAEQPADPSSGWLVTAGDADHLAAVFGWTLSDGTSESAWSALVLDRAATTVLTSASGTGDAPTSTGLLPDGTVVIAVTATDGHAHGLAVPPGGAPVELGGAPIGAPIGDAIPATVTGGWGWLRLDDGAPQFTLLSDVPVDAIATSSALVTLVDDGGPVVRLERPDGTRTSIPLDEPSVDGFGFLSSGPVSAAIGTTSDRVPRYVVDVSRATIEPVTWDAPGGRAPMTDGPCNRAPVFGADGTMYVAARDERIATSYAVADGVWTPIGLTAAGVTGFGPSQTASGTTLIAGALASDGSGSCPAPTWGDASGVNPAPVVGAQVQVARPSAGIAEVVAPELAQTAAASPDGLCLGAVAYTDVTGEIVVQDVRSGDRTVLGNGTAYGWLP